MFSLEGCGSQCGSLSHVCFRISCVPANGFVLSSLCYVLHTPRCERSKLWNLNKQQAQAALRGHLRKVTWFVAVFLWTVRGIEKVCRTPGIFPTQKKKIPDFSRPQQKGGSEVWGKTLKVIGWDFCSADDTCYKLASRLSKLATLTAHHRPHG